MTPTYIEASHLERDRRVDRFLGRQSPEIARWLVECIHRIADGDVAVLPSTRHEHLYFGDVDGFTIRMSLNEERGVLVILDIHDRHG